MQILSVAPLAGARIEMYKELYTYMCKLVAPLAGARIEIAMEADPTELAMSLPSRERGLK